jgi:NAD(P)-dependent dehydrogenase (short-subunit alcohol dehydrogenase family)
MTKKSQTKMKEIALVTGANKGIGFEVSKVLAKHGMKVIMGARNEVRGRKAMEMLKKQGLDVEFILLDLADEESIASAPGQIRKNWGNLDVLVNNAGILHRDEGLGSSTVLGVPVSILRETFETNFFGLVNLTQRLVPLLKKSKNGRIINVSSILGSLQKATVREADGPSGTPFAYNASKAAVNAFTIHLAGALRPVGIRVNSVHPGWVKTDMGSDQAPLSIEEGAKTIIDLVLYDNESNSRFIHLGEELPW